MKKTILKLVQSVIKKLNSFEEKFSDEKKLTALEKKYRLALLKTEAILIKETLLSHFFSLSPSVLTIEKASALLEHIEFTYYPFFSTISDKNMIRILGSIVSLHNAKSRNAENSDSYEKELLLTIVKVIDTGNLLSKLNDNDLHQKLLDIETYRAKM